MKERQDARTNSSFYSSPQSYYINTRQKNSRSADNIPSSSCWTNLEVRSPKHYFERLHFRPTLESAKLPFSDRRRFYHFSSSPEISPSRLSQGLQKRQLDSSTHPPAPKSLQPKPDIKPGKHVNWFSGVTEPRQHNVDSIACERQTRSLLRCC